MRPRQDNKDTTSKSLQVLQEQYRNRAAAITLSTFQANLKDIRPTNSHVHFPRSPFALFLSFFLLCLSLNWWLGARYFFAAFLVGFLMLAKARLRPQVTEGLMSSHLQNEKRMRRHSGVPPHHQHHHLTIIRI